MDAAKAFYGKGLGYMEMSPGRFKVNDHQYVELLSDPPAPDPPAQTKNYMSHLCFLTDNVEQMRTYLASNGIQVPAHTSRTRTGGPVGAYDGTWNVVFTTQAGNCSSTNSAPFAVSGKRVASAGGGKVTGGIGRGGAVSVRISVGLSVASGTGRLAGNSGVGRWSGIISGDKCSGSWQATRN